MLQSNNLLHNENCLSGKLGHVSEYISAICYKVTIYYTMRTDYLVSLDNFFWIHLSDMLQSNNLLHNENWLSGKLGHFSQYVSVICYKATIYYTMRTDYLVSLDIFLNTSQLYVTKWQSTTQWGLIKLGHFSEYISVICYKATIYYTMRTDYLVSLDIFLNTSQWYVTKQQSTIQWELIIW